MADKKLSEETNQLTDLTNKVRIYGIEDATGTPVSGYINLDNITLKIANKDINSNVSVPTITENGYVIAWNNTNSNYELIEVNTDSTYISSNGLTGDGTTYIDTDDSTYANQIIGKSPQTGTGYMVQIFNGETVAEPTFQVQANGSILNQGLATIMYKSGVDSVFVGTYKPHSNATGSNNFAAGYFAGSSITTGQSGVMIGANAGILTTTANYNVFVGADSGRTNVSGNANVYVGYSAGYLNKGDRCIFIGNQAGKGQSNVDNRLLISGYAFGDAATELTNSIIRGEMGATPSVQELYFNSQKINMNYLPTSAAGLASGDIWNNSGVINIV